MITLHTESFNIKTIKYVFVKKQHYFYFKNWIKSAIFFRRMRRNEDEDLYY